MNLARPFIRRPVGSAMLAFAILLAGLLSWGRLPVAALPAMDTPAILVTASLPGASPAGMASTVAGPLERALGAISGLDSISSSSTQGNTQVRLFFNIDRDLNEAARDVQAAINGVIDQLPSGMSGRPSFRKMNPSTAPILALALSSSELTPGQLYDIAVDVVQQKLSRVPGVSQVSLGGSSLPAVRIAFEPSALAAKGISLEEARQAVAQANADAPHGFLETEKHRWLIASGKALKKAADFAPLVIRWVDGSPVRLSDVATVTDSVEDRYVSGFHNDRPAIIAQITRQPNANIVATIDEIKERMPELRALLPPQAILSVVMDRSKGIRGSLDEAQLTLLLSCLIVAGVVWLFVARFRIALISVAVIPVALIGTFGVIYLAGFSLNNLSVMALVVAAGLVVDDAIVVLENVSRYSERGMSTYRATLRGAGEVSFTLLAMNLALVVVFVAVLFAGGMLERLFREFSITLAAALIISLLISVSLTPALCAHMLPAQWRESRWTYMHAGYFSGLQQLYEHSLQYVLRHLWLAALAVVGLILGSIWMFTVVPRGELPEQDTGVLAAFVRGDDGFSFQVMQPRIEAYRRWILSDPAVQDVAGTSGGTGGISNARLMITLRPLSERNVSARRVADRLRSNAPPLPGAVLAARVEQDIMLSPPRFGDDSDHQIVLKSGDLDLLRRWNLELGRALSELPELTGVSFNTGEDTRQITLDIDRTAATRLGVTMRDISATLSNSFSQRQVATVYEDTEQYKVVMEVDERFSQNPLLLDRVQIITSEGKSVALPQVATWRFSMVRDRENHVDQFAATTISFSVSPTATDQKAMAAVHQTINDLRVPSAVITDIDGANGMPPTLVSADGQGWLVLGVVLTVYLVLGILYESLLHPITVLSTVPSAGVGAMLALWFSNTPFSLIALLGLFLLIGVVMKNGILMVDFALKKQREGFDAAQAILHAAGQRLRPILMTNTAALLGAVPLALGMGEGGELRRPLGLAIIGGLAVSQLITLYTTPAIFLMLERLHQCWNRWTGRGPDGGGRTAGPVTVIPPTLRGPTEIFPATREFPSTREREAIEAAETAVMAGPQGAATTGGAGASMPGSRHRPDPGATPTPGADRRKGASGVPGGGKTPDAGNAADAGRATGPKRDPDTPRRS